jgi:hypothetical protein
MSLIIASPDKRVFNPYRIVCHIQASFVAKPVQFQQSVTPAQGAFSLYSTNVRPDKDNSLPPNLPTQRDSLPQGKYAGRFLLHSPMK